MHDIAKLFRQKYLFKKLFLLKQKNISLKYFNKIIYIRYIFDQKLEC